MLAIYGTKDWIVPFQENTKRLKSFFKEDQTDLLKVVWAHEGGHSLEAEDRYVTINENQDYYHFFRISPEVSIELISFLRKHQFID